MLIALILTFSHARFLIEEIDPRSAGLHEIQEVGGLNNSGVVVGGAGMAFRYERGQIRELPISDEIRQRAYGDGIGAAAHDITDEGMIVGEAGGGFPLGMSGLDAAEAVRWDRDGKMSALHPSYTSGSSYVANAANERSDITGSDEHWAFVLSNGNLFRLHPLSRLPAGNRMETYDINERGEAVGWSTVGKQAMARIYLWKDGKECGIAIPGATHVFGYAIDDRGEIVGMEMADGGFGGKRAFRWRNGKVRWLPNPRGVGDIQIMRTNNRRQAVGFYYPKVRTNGNDEWRAAMWEVGRATDLTSQLGDPDWTLFQATDINERGQICGLGRHRGRRVGYLLTPVP